MTVTTFPKTVEQLFGQFGRLPTSLNEYARDAWQRSILFLDILRRRGNQREEMITHRAASVLIYDTELVMRGDTLPHPVNYSLLRVIPTEGVAIDDRKRPVVAIDPRAGQGPGIGGFKPVSEIGDAFKAGHPVYFIGFSADPIEGQRIEDIARAHTVFIKRVSELHPDALGKPFVIGNCQAGWHAMMAACMRPDLIGSILIAGAPLSYWGGVHGKNPMRYTGGVLGGSWIARMVSDIGNGVFDGAWLVSNFDNLNPANTLWTKQYNVWSDPEHEEDRYLKFEEWWGDFVVLRGEELQWMVDNLFVGNKFSTAQLVTTDGIRLDIREIKVPIICFCSHGDNITPPQQALDWILDNYQSVDDIRRCGQRIFYCIDPKVGHLAIFVATSVAAKDHAKFVDNMELIDTMPPGLYEIVITEKPGTQSANAKGLPGFELRIDARGLDDIRALGGNSVEDEREFAAVARVSEVNNAFYESFLQPWIKAVSSPHFARAALEMHPLRLSYSLWSDKNPMMRLLAPLTVQAKAERAVPAAENLFVGLQQQFSKAMIDALNAYGDARDKLTEQIFHAIYGSMVVQAACGIAQKDGPPRPRPGLSPSTKTAIDSEVRRLQDRVAVGGPMEAIARAIVYIGKSEHHVGESTFDALRRLLLAHPKVSPAEFKAALRDQWAIVHLDERTAIETLPQLLPSNPSERRALLDALKAIVTATSDLSIEGQRRWAEITQLFESGSRRVSTTREELPVGQTASPRGV
jgi:pimeloyl-ACP methyl ester carboxylesterase